MESILLNWLFLNAPKEPNLGSIAEHELREKIKKREFVYCRNCKHAITSADQRVGIHGAFSKEFTNPHGILFRIGFFKLAEGCYFASEPTPEWTWFPGYSWRIVHCENCSSHLGWHFQNQVGHDFFGLILNRLSS